MDFGDAASAQGMFVIKKNEASELVTWDEFGEQAAIMVTGGGYVFEVYAYFDNYYYWLQFQGIQGEENAKNTASDFLSLYQLRMQQ
jgi:hypothetical protein